MSVLRRIKRALEISPTAIRHNHVYTDHITGERFEITTVGRWVEIERLDSERRDENSVRKGVMRDAISSGMVEHIPSTCPMCDTRNKN